MGAPENQAKENAACQVWLRTNTRYERVAPEGIHCDRAVIYHTLSLFYVSSSQFHRPFLFHSLCLSLPVCTEGRGQAALLFLPAVATKCFIKTGTKYECPLC